METCVGPRERLATKPLVEKVVVATTPLQEDELAGVGKEVREIDLPQRKKLDSLDELAYIPGHPVFHVWRSVYAEGYAWTAEGWVYVSGGTRGAAGGSQVGIAQDQSRDRHRGGGRKTRTLRH